MNEETGKIEYHYGFYAGIHILCQSVNADFTFLQEYELGKEPVRLDMLIINRNDRSISNDKIISFFKEHNVIEYKSPDDGLDIHDFFKVQGYACLYQALNNLDIDVITTSIFRHKCPKKMFTDLMDKGFDVQKAEYGIYHVTGRIPFATQVIVTSELPKGEYGELKILARDADKADIVGFIREARTRYNLEDIRAILRVSIALNKDLYQKLREESIMEDVFKEFFHDELAASEARGISIGEARARNSIMKNLIASGMSQHEAAKITGINI